MGKAFGKEERADSLISYISETKAECESRVSAVYDTGISAYIGGGLQRIARNHINP